MRVLSLVILITTGLASADTCKVSDAVRLIQIKSHVENKYLGPVLVSSTQTHELDAEKNASLTENQVESFLQSCPGASTSSSELHQVLMQAQQTLSGKPYTGNYSELPFVTVPNNPPTGVTNIVFDLNRFVACHLKATLDKDCEQGRDYDGFEDSSDANEASHFAGQQYLIYWHVFSAKPL